jgi:hypothetical protein
MARASVLADRSTVVFGRDVRYTRKSDEGLGRFGGGWSWNVGVQVGAGSVIINLLVASVRISRKRAVIR